MDELEGFVRVKEEVGSRLEKTLTLREIAYLSGKFSSGGAIQWICLWPILPHEMQ
jgi:hypothetical protein